jgi:hypothetical protein
MTPRGYSFPFILTLAAMCVLTGRDASAQLDPLLFIKRMPPNVIIAVDTANRMQRDIANDYLDPNVYTRTGALWEPSIGIGSNVTTKYRRKYVNLQNTDPATAGDKFSADTIKVVGDKDTGFTTFDDQTKLAIARKALTEVVTANMNLVRFALLKTRQRDAKIGAEKNEGPVKTSDPVMSVMTETGGTAKWKITRPEVGALNGSLAYGSASPVPLIQVDSVASGLTANQRILTTLGMYPHQSDTKTFTLVPGGRDGMGYVDAPIDNMLDDARTEAVRLLSADTQCRQTVVVLIVAGGEGHSTNEDIATKAKSFVNVRDGFDVPIHVIALAPPAADESALRLVAENSGGVYTKITKEMVDAVPTGQPVPELVRAVNYAVSETFQNTTEFNVDPTLTFSRGPETEHQVTSPIIGSVNLDGALDIKGLPLVNDIIKNEKTGTVIPQRSNVLITTGFALPGFEARMRAFRVYRPEVDTSKAAGYKFVADGTRLWVASVPEASRRNIFTVLPDGTTLTFTSDNAAVLEPYLQTTDAKTGTKYMDAAKLIEYVRNQPLGAIVGSTPAMMDPPSLDPPPDSDYPGFLAENAKRRSIIWVGANDGMIHAIDARLGKEVWAFIPFNLLPKLKTLMHGQPVGSFRYFVDSSPKVADVKIDGKWRTYLIIGEGAGGTFYQAFDVTLDKMGDTVLPTEGNIDVVLSYFADKDRVPFRWSFPHYKDFDHTLVDTAKGIYWGDIAATAPVVSKTVGQTWSDPAVGQIENVTGPYTVITGSGFLPFTMETAANRAGVVAGSSLYLLNAETGELYDSRSVGADTSAEKIDNCVTANDCTKLKNAIQADPVATGPADSRYINKTYVGDLDGKLWRFDLKLDAAKIPKVNTLTKLYDAGAGHPMFSSMATVTVGGVNQYLFQATGSDLLPSNNVSQQYQLLIVKDNGASGTLATTGGKPILLEKVDGLGNDEKVTSFPAVAGDIVFFSTTNYKPAAPCTLPDGNLYAFTFIGGPAYDTTNDGKVDSADKPKITTTVGERASAPFIVDQHVVFASGNKIQMLGDPEDFNNGVGQAGVRILSWREVR